MNRQQAFDTAQAIKEEALDAATHYPPFNSAHEGLAILEEEFQELKDEVFKKQSLHDFEKMKHEAIQVGAMALRFIVDVCENGKTGN